MVSPSLMLTKCTFFSLYLQIYRPFKILRISIYAGLVVTVLFYISVTIALLAYLAPRPGQSWLNQTEIAASSVNVRISAPISAVGVAIDSYTFFIPVFGVMGLQMSLKNKVGVLVVFTTGLMLGSVSYWIRRS